MLSNTREVLLTWKPTIGARSISVPQSEHAPRLAVAAVSRHLAAGVGVVMGRIIRTVLGFIVLFFILVATFRTPGLSMWLAAIVIWFIAWRLGAFRPRTQKLQARIEKGEVPRLVVRTYRTDKEFEKDAAGMEALGYAIESRHVVPQSTYRGTSYTEWHVTYVRSAEDPPATG